MKTLRSSAIASTFAAAAALWLPGVSLGQAAEFSVRLVRGSCYGFCPVYEVDIRSDGTVMYTGHDFVVTKGSAEGRLDDDSILRLFEAFRTAGFLGLSGDCCNCAELTDMPTTRVTLSLDGVAKEIEDYHGCSKAPKALRLLENEIDDIVRVEQWIGTADQRRRLRNRP